MPASSNHLRADVIETSRKARPTGGDLPYSHGVPFQNEQRGEGFSANYKRDQRVIAYSLAKLSAPTSCP